MQRAQVVPSTVAVPSVSATIDRLGRCRPTGAPQDWQRSRSNDAKFWHTGQAKARMGLIVARASEPSRTLWQVPPPDDSDRLSADDGRILSLESASIAGHTLKLMILEPGAGALDIEALRAAVTERLDSQPRATHRVDTSRPGARWVPAEAISTSASTSGAGPTRSVSRRPTCGGSSVG